jgi:hypothetical protein
MKMTKILNKLAKLQQAWQAQCNRTPDVNPDQLLNSTRLQRKAYFWSDMFVIAVFVWCGGGMLIFSLRDFQDDWPWLVYTACCAWVVGYILFNRWRRRRFVAHYEDSVLAHVEWSINDIEHRMRVDRYTLWWYILPIALGCMIPPAISFVVEFRRKPELDMTSLIFNLFFEVFFIAAFYIIHWTMKRARRIGMDGQLKQLDALRAFRDNLLKEEEGK